jgi:heterodisulfide reductase subunit A
MHLTIQFDRGNLPLPWEIISVSRTLGIGNKTDKFFVISHPREEVCRMTQSATQSAIGSVMVVGGGIAGMQAALDLANSGYYVYLLEKSPSIGGVMSQLDKTFPTNDCAM